MSNHLYPSLSEKEIMAELSRVADQELKDLIWTKYVCLLECISTSNSFDDEAFHKFMSRTYRIFKEKFPEKFSED